MTHCLADERVDTRRHYLRRLMNRAEWEKVRVKRGLESFHHRDKLVCSDELFMERRTIFSIA